MFKSSKLRVTSNDNVNGTDNYVWSTENFLGRGATANVYRGADKTTGEPVAVKVFSSQFDFRESQLKETEMLRRLDHENIVKLIDIQRELKNGNYVVVMELCEGRSLGGILDDPEYALGFNEEEFLLVLDHVTAGMRYLRSNGIAHRDLKPANVVKFVKDDGSNVYKLTDFGAAKAVEEDEYFKSLCGTEEYLYPDIYEKAIMKSSENIVFPASVDLWSMGCTIYHVVTGLLPFRPYGGRKNRKALQFIHQNKGPGFISAVQRRDGTVDFSKDLPENIQLSPDMRETVTVLLQGLLEKDKMWTFSRYFEAVAKILNKKPVYIFDVLNCVEHKLYLDPEETVQDFKEHLHFRTAVLQENQVIIQNGKILELESKPKTLASIALQVTSKHEPLILLSKGNTDLKMTERMVTVPKVKFPTFGIGIPSLDQDIPVAKEFTKVAYLYARHIEEVNRCHVLLLDVPVAVNSVITETIEVLHQTSTNSLKLVLSLDYNLKAFLVFKQLIPLLGMSQEKKEKEFSCSVTRLGKLRKDVNSAYKTLAKKVVSIRDKYVSDQFLDRLWQQGLKNCEVSSGVNQIVKTYVKTIRSSWQTLQNFIQKIPLSFDDNEFAKLEKVIISRFGSKLINLDKLSIDNLQRSVSEFDTWYNSAQAVLAQCQCLRTELEQIGILLKDYEVAIKAEQGMFEELELKLQSESSRRTNFPNGEKITMIDFVASFQELKDSQLSIKSLIGETNCAINNFNTLLAELPSLELENPSDQTTETYNKF